MERTNDPFWQWVDDHNADDLDDLGTVQDICDQYTQETGNAVLPETSDQLNAMIKLDLEASLGGKFISCKNCHTVALAKDEKDEWICSHCNTQNP